MTQKQRSLVGGISILGMAGLICKVVGVLYKIPLANLIGAEGIGVYQQVFPTYNLMLTVSSAGIPVAISRMVAFHLARGRAKNTLAILRVSLAVLAALGAVSMLLMLALSGQLARATSTPESRLGFVFIAPSLLLVCVLSAYRGYMQGHRMMWPTAISQLIEQVGKVGLALPLAYSFMQRGGFALGAAGALLGTSLAEAAALLYMIINAQFVKPGMINAAALDQTPPDSFLRIARELVFSAVPITIGASIMPLAGAVDSFMLVRLMKAYLPEMQALSRYGIYSGLVIALINVPTALAMALSSNLVPSISSKRASGDREGIRRDSAAGLKLAVVIGLPCSVGMSLLAEPIMFLLFSGGQYTLQELRMGAQLLSISALTIVVFTLVQASSGILQGLYKQRIPMYTLMLGVSLNIVIEYIMVSRPNINIFGAPVSSLTCYLLSAGLNIAYVRKYAGMALDVRELLLRPAAATLIMALPVWALARILDSRLQSSWILSGFVIVLAVLIFIAAAFATGALSPFDLPGKHRKGT